MSKPRPIIMIRRGYSVIYGTLTQAEQASGISRSKILTALNSDDGSVKGMRPFTQFDDALLTEEDEAAIVNEALAKVDNFDKEPQSKEKM